MNILTAIFGNEGKVKIMRLFLFNPHLSYDIGSVSKRAQVSLREAREHIKMLARSRIILSRTILNKSGNFRKRAKRIKGWALNQKFPQKTALQDFLIDITSISKTDLLKRLSRVGRLRLIVLSGIFLHDLESRVDILIVGEHLKKKVIESSIRSLEARMGRELTYAFFETSDFTYRMSIYDRLVRDVLDYPHQVILDRLGLGQRQTH